MASHTLTFGQADMAGAAILRKFLLCLSFCLVASSADTGWAQGFGGDRGGDRGGFFGGPPSPERMFGSMDRNQDGRVTEDEVPSFLRDRMSGVDLRRGATQEDLSRAFERMRQERESSGRDFGRPGFGGPPGFGPPGFGGPPGTPGSSFQPGSNGSSPWQSSSSERSSSERDRSRGNSNGGMYSSARKPRLTTDMPLSYADGDLDNDGQIGFHEWRKWRRSQTENFFIIDANSDGFLTPTELVGASAALSSAARNAASTTASTPGGPPVPGAAPGTSPTAAATPAPVLPNGRRGFPGAPTPPASSPATESAAGSSSTTQNVSTGTESQDVTRRRAESMFRSLDRNRDGMVNEEEFSISRTLRPMFQGAGVDISQPMSSAVFVETYIRLNTR